MSRTAVVLVNWNGWGDTIECLENLFNTLPADVRIIVCDNGSSDESLHRLTDWASGHLAAAVSAGQPLYELSATPVPKPVPFSLHSRTAAESGGAPDDPRLVLIDIGENLGFAAGNNVALRYLLAREEFDHVWLLNNDTVIAPGALEALLERMAQRPDAGMCGATLLRYDAPERVQARGGGWYCCWLGLAWHLGQLGRADAAVDAAAVERRMSYVVGASMFISREFLLQVGLMSEDYFIYFEELDWALRSRSRFALAYAPACRVYHKVGRSVGSGFLPHRKSYLSDYYNIRNRLRFTARYYPLAMPILLLTLCGAIMLRLLSGQWDRAMMVWQLIRTNGAWEFPREKIA